MITHQEAEILTSARQDAPLDAMVERELQAHLATCEQCRSFAAATERLTAGIRTLPGIAANPRVKREVMDRVRAGRGPFAGLMGTFGNGFQPGPAFAAIAMVAVIGIFGWLALDRLFFDEGGDGSNQIAAVPTAAITLEMSTPTAPPTATIAAVTAEPTQTPSATTAPQPTNTAVPTESPSPTATTVAEPTATLVPTATSAPQPTATSAPTAEPTPDEGPIDLTRSSNTTSRVEPTVAPTQTAVPPTATAQPTPEPTATSVPPTPTPDVVPTATETPLPEPTPTPAIEPMDGSTSQPVDTGDSANILGIGSADDDADIPTAPAGGGDAAETPTSDVGGTDDGAARIEPIDPEGQGAGGETTPESGIEMTEGAAAGPSQLLADVSQPYGGIVGDPADSLGLTSDGRLEFMAVPDGASMTTAEGVRLQMADAQPGVVQVCGDAFCEPGMSAPEAGDWQGDIPLGVVNDNAFILRLYADRAEVVTLQPQGTQLLEGSLIAEFGPLAGPMAVYESDGSLYAWLPSGEWLRVSGDSAQLLPGAYANPANVRFAPSAQGGPMMGYFSGGSLIIAPVAAPDAAILALPTDGVDFDISPPGDRVAVIRGTSIVIYDLQGNELAVYEGGEMQPGSLIWLRGGIVWVDRTTGFLFEIAETAP